MKLQKNIPIYIMTSLLAASCASSPQGTAPQAAEEPSAAKAAYEAFVRNVEGISIAVSSAPAETVKLKAFPSSYAVTVTRDGVPAPGLELDVSYPLAKDGDSVQFTHERLSTDAAGTARFSPPVPAESFNSTLSFRPYGDMANKDIACEAAKYAVSAPYRVRTDLRNSGGLISLVDFSADGKPLPGSTASSSTLLSALMRLGFTGMGNADLSASVLTGDVQAVYDEARSLVGGSLAFVVSGTVRQVAADRVPGGYDCLLEGTVSCVSLKTGAELYRTVRTATAFEKTEGSALASARRKLAEDLASAINYGM